MSSSSSVPGASLSNRSASGRKGGGKAGSAQQPATAKQKQATLDAPDAPRAAGPKEREKPKKATLNKSEVAAAAPLTPDERSEVLDQYGPPLECGVLIAALSRDLKVTNDEAGFNQLLCSRCGPTCPKCNERNGPLFKKRGPHCYQCAIKAGVVTEDFPAWWKPKWCNICASNPPSPAWDLKWLDDWQFAPTTIVPKAKIEAAGRVNIDVSRMQVGSATNPHCVMAASRVTVELALSTKLKQAWGRPGYLEQNQPTLIIVGCGNRQQVDKIRKQVPKLRIVTFGPHGETADPMDVTRTSGDQWGTGGPSAEYWHRVGESVKTAGPGSHVFIYNTCYFLPGSLVGVFDAAQRRGVTIMATAMLPPREASGFMRNALFLPPYSNETGVNMYEAVVLRVGDMMRTIVDGNGQAYEHPVPGNHWIAGKVDGGMAALTWSPICRTAPVLAANGSWFTTAAGRVWMPRRVDPATDDLAKTEASCLGAIRGYYASTRSLAQQLVPPALDEVQMKQVATMWAAATTESLSLADRVKKSVLQLGSPVANRVLGHVGIGGVFAVLLTLATTFSGCGFLPSTSVRVARLQAAIGLLAVVVTCVGGQVDWLTAVASVGTLAATATGWPAGYARVRRGWLVGAATGLMWLLLIGLIVIKQGLLEYERIGYKEVVYTPEALAVYEEVHYKSLVTMDRAFGLGGIVNIDAYRPYDPCANRPICHIDERRIGTYIVQTVTAERLKVMADSFNPHFRYPTVVASWVEFIARPDVKAFVALIGGPAFGVMAPFGVVGMVVGLFVGVAVAYFLPLMLIAHVLTSIYVGAFRRSSVLLDEWPVQPDTFNPVMPAIVLAAWLVTHLIPNLSKRPVDAPSAAVPGLVVGIDAGKFEATVGASKRTLVVKQAIEQAVARTGSVLKSCAFVVLRAAGTVAPYAIYKRSTAAAVRARYLVSAPAETDAGVATFTSYLEELKSKVGPVSTEEVVAFAYEHAYKFTGAKRESYLAAAEYLRTGAHTWTWINSYRSVKQVLARGIAAITGFTKTELSPVKGAKPGENVLPSATADEVEALYTAVWRKAKPRMICFPAALSDAGYEVIAGVFATHCIVKKYLKEMWDAGYCLDPCVDLTQFARDYRAALDALGTIPGATRDMVFSQLRGQYRHLGHNDELVYRPHLLGSTFCSKVIMPCSSRQGPAFAFTVPLHRLFSRMLAVDTCTAKEAPAVLNDKLACLALLEEPSYYGSLMVRIAQLYVQRITTRCMSKKAIGGWEGFTAQTGAFWPCQREHELEFWSAWYGRDLSQLEVELEMLQGDLSRVDTQLRHDPVFGHTCALHPLELSPTVYPILSDWLLPGYSNEGFADPACAIEDVCRSALAGDREARATVLSLARDKRPLGVEVLDNQAPDRGARKTAEMVERVCEMVRARDNPVLLLIGAGKVETVETFEAKLPDCLILLSEVGQPYAKLAALDYTNHTNLHLLPEGCDAEELAIFLRGVGRVCESAVVWCDVPLIPKAGCGAIPIDQVEGLCDALGEWAGSATLLLKLSQAAPYRAYMIVENGEERRVTAADLVVPAYSRSPRANGAAEAYLYIQDSLTTELHVADVPVEEEWGTLAVDIIATRVLNRGMQPDGLRLSCDDTALEARQRMINVAALTGLSAYDNVLPVEVDAASCDGSHQRGLVILQNQLLETVEQLFPQINLTQLSDLLFGPVIMQDGETVSRAWLGSLADQMVALFSGLPWTTLANGLRFTHATRRVLEGLLSTQDPDKLRDKAAVASTGDDLLAAVRVTGC